MPALLSCGCGNVYIISELTQHKRCRERVKRFYKTSTDVGWYIKCRNKERLLHSGIFAIVPTCKSVILYGATIFSVGTMVNAPLYSSYSLFLYIYASPTFVLVFVENS